MNVYFSIDTESSMAGAWRLPARRPLKSDRHVFCRIGGKDHGIGLITDILANFGFRATHFVETLATLVNGGDDTAAIFDFLLSRGQDVQLHVHPTYRYYFDALNVRTRGQEYVPPQPNDLLAEFPADRQMELLHESLMLFERFAGFRPSAFRAGSFSANGTTLNCLRQLGISLDSSFNPCYPSLSFRGENLVPNRVCQINGVWEMPIAVARTPLQEGVNGLKPADPSSVSSRELETMLETGVTSGQQHFVMILHSFSMIKSKDESYSDIRPNQIVIQRLERLVKYLAAHPDRYRVRTFGELAAQLPEAEHAEPTLADLGLFSAGVRKAVQGINRFYWV
jgi:hypothetical protein